MAYPYISRVKKQYRSSGDEYVYDERVEPGQMLSAALIGAYHDNPTSDDKIEIGITDGDQRYKIDYKQLTGDPGMLGTNVHIDVPPGWGIYAYFSTAAAGDNNELLVCGVMYTTQEWMKKHGKVTE